ncbi:Aste57867_14096 [Aphanomyces stellatus]|uniref:Aste57867_14096 protein n=1 Tax=Aphanomyces stellatus TaxID=120398 RepID=A0A485L218_9STRA|nr:hypothetical protein As57867_014045 [Aphanomyces stellatus]VFT90924.1 Aste57867_14096 [Aphanomyces stellatus]
MVLDIVNELVQHGADVNLAGGPSGLTPLTHASASGHLDVVQELLALGALIDAPTESGWTALYYAIREGHMAIFNALLQRGASASTFTVHARASHLFIACDIGALDMVQAMLAHGAEVDKPTLHGDTPLFVTCDKGHLEVVRELIQNGANVNSKTFVRDREPRCHSTHEVAGLEIAAANCRYEWAFI